MMLLLRAWAHTVGEYTTAVVETEKRLLSADLQDPEGIHRWCAVDRRWVHWTEIRSPVALREMARWLLRRAGRETPLSSALGARARELDVVVRARARTIEWGPGRQVTIRGGR